jgi:uncharacterized protein
MKVLIAGASGLVGSALMPALFAARHQPVRLVRDSSQAQVGNVRWNPARGELDASAVADCDAIVNLSGESIAAGRWTAAQKERIRDSRLSATRTIAQALAAAPPKLRTLVNASAIGYYGNRGDEVLDETSAPGDDFLAGVCREWESETEPAAQAGVRVVLARFGVILSSRGGALKKMLLPFRLGAGGKIGSGKQWMSWIALDDVVAALVHALRTPSLAGPVNVVAPNPVTNLEFTKTLGHILHRPTIMPMPAFAARLALGEMADSLLLASQDVRPAVLSTSGFTFKYVTLADALRHVLSGA